MKLLLSRRMAILGLFTATIASTAPKALVRYKVTWKKLSDESVGPGDMWASHDPNTPELQGEFRYNLIMQAINPSCYGTPAKKIGIGNGGFWRPTGIVAC